MAIKVKSTKDVIHFVNLMIYGDAGIGKTVLCSTAPAPIIISAEGGLLSLADKDLPVIEVECVKDVNQVYDWLTKSKEADQYQTVCVDSISELAEKLLNEELAQNRDGRAAYGVMASLMMLTLRGFRDLSKHTYFTAKMKEITEEATGVTTFRPSLPGQVLPANVPYLFDELFYYDIVRIKGKRIRALQTENNRKFVAKDRSGKLDTLEKPDLTHIFNKILSKPENAKVTQTQTK